MLRTNLTLALFLLIGNVLIAQSRLKTSEGEISFNASTPLEDIFAVNKEVNAIISLESGEFASVLLMRDFKFKRALMQEHFNENYVESEKYPKAYFTGIIQGFAAIPSATSEKEFTIEGKLTIHGVSRSFTTNARIYKQSKGVAIRSSFIIKPEDFNIEVPRLLFKKIAQEVTVEITFLLEADG